ncbi:hypothetical protein MKQ68_13300 [Chitinophaga horti]|uniref:Bacteriocin n=1 Tax=Chitinophaga horti TaxID=2920382 RepID=A0ABY6IUM1_9BACT|nr:hypothetical protein [Chitinophaga horti]UYQ91069.1 hypothetical protein MKQ68_13300 [Chitinophaga horti]
MKTLSFYSTDLQEMSASEMMNCGGGISLPQVLANWFGGMILNHAHEIYLSAQATRRTFEEHPEIFVK